MAGHVAKAASMISLGPVMHGGEAQTGRPESNTYRDRILREQVGDAKVGVLSGCRPSSESVAEA